jgi:hypothetical protein
MILRWSPFKTVSVSAVLYPRWPPLISIFSNGGHLGWRAGLSDTILKGTHPGTIPARFDLIWFSGFREEDLNVIFYQNMPNLHNRSFESSAPFFSSPCHHFSSVVRPSTFHILIFSSGTTGPIATKLWWN